MTEPAKTPPDQALLDSFERAIKAYVTLAESFGIVITVEQVVDPRPPTPGRTETRVSVRPARGYY